MANFDTLKAAIVEVVKTNGNNEITGALLQDTLLAMVDSLGTGYQFKGGAVPSTDPGTPDQKVAYFAGPGTYPNFGPATIPDGYVGIFYGSGSTWNVATAKTSPFTAVTVANDIIQLMDGTTPVYPRTRAEAVFFGNDQTDTLDEKVEEIEVNISQLGQERFNSSFIGEGNTYSSNTLNTLVRGHRYKIYIKNSDYARDQVTASGYIFSIYSDDETNNRTFLVAVAPGGTVESEYLFIVPNDSVSIVVGGRANTGVSVYYELVDVTYADTLFRSNNYIPLKNIKDYFQTGTVSRDGNNKKLITPGATQVRYLEIADFTVLVQYIRISNFKYTPSTGSGNTYTTIIFFDSQDNCISLINAKNDVDIDSMILAIPEGATQCYINVPAIHLDELVLWHGDWVDSKQVLGISSIENSISSIESSISLIDGVAVAKLSPTTGIIISYNATTLKKTITANPAVSHIELDMSELSERVYVYNISSYVPSTGSQSTYTRILFFDNDDTLISQVSTPVIGTTLYLDVPANATQCYIDFPEAKKNEVKVRTGQKEYDSLSFAADANSIYERNADRIPMLTASCRYRKSSDTGADFQMVIATDSHGDSVCVRNAVDAVNVFMTPWVDAFIHCGDCVPDTFKLGQDNNSLWKDIVASCKRPYFFVMGNHEKGTYPAIISTPTDEELYNTFVKPSVDAGHISAYTVNKLYYYKDFTQKKIRLIVLDEYETPLIIDDSIWEPISYDNSLADYVAGGTYSTGDKVNVPGYTTYSFQAKQNVTIGAYSGSTMPCYKYRRGYRWISQTQAQWFLDTLASTPNNYKVIVACHNPFSKLADVDQTRMFSQKNGWVNGGPYIQNYMTNDFIADAINAYQTRTNFSTTCSSSHPDDMPSYQVSKNFASALGTFHSLIGGHVHQDCVWKHQTYEQYQITPICTNSNTYSQSTNADIRRSDSDTVNRVDVDSLTVVSFGDNRIGLVKLGVNVTETGARRDFELIALNP